MVALVAALINGAIDFQADKVADIARVRDKSQGQHISVAEPRYR